MERLEVGEINLVDKKAGLTGRVLLSLECLQCDSTVHIELLPDQVVSMRDWLDEWVKSRKGGMKK